MSNVSLIAQDANEQRVWGHPYQGLSLSIQPEEFRLNQPMEIRIALKNTRASQVSIRSTGGLSDYRVLLMNKHGEPVSPSAKARHAEEPRMTTEPQAFSYSDQEIEQGKIAYQMILLNERFEIKAEGTYFFIVMRPLLS